MTCPKGGCTVFCFDLNQRNIDSIGLQYIVESYRMSRRLLKNGWSHGQLGKQKVNMNEAIEEISRNIEARLKNPLVFGFLSHG